MGQQFYNGDFFSMNALVQRNVRQTVHIVVEGSYAVGERAKLVVNIGIFPEDFKLMAISIPNRNG